MPTERFLRLPKEKDRSNSDRSGKGIYEGALEEASINRIVHDADISRGSFYTYFEDKQDLLKWLIYAQAEQHFNIVYHDADENGGDSVEVLEQIFDLGMDLMERACLINIFQNLINSARLFMDIIQRRSESNPRR